MCPQISLPENISKFAQLRGCFSCLVLALWKIFRLMMEWNFYLQMDKSVSNFELLFICMQGQVCLRQNPTTYPSTQKDRQT